MNGNLLFTRIITNFVKTFLYEINNYSIGVSRVYIKTTM